MENERKKIFDFPVPRQGYGSFREAATLSLARAPVSVRSPVFDPTAGSKSFTAVVHYQIAREIYRDAHWLNVRRLPDSLPNTVRTCLCCMGQVWRAENHDCPAAV